MKKIAIVVLLMMLVVSCAVLLSACEAPQTYFEENGLDWIRFGRGDWEDREGNSGVYERDGSQLYFFMDDVEVFSGALKNGTFTKKVAGVTVGVYRTSEAQAAREKNKK